MGVRTTIKFCPELRSVAQTFELDEHDIISPESAISARYSPDRAERDQKRRSAILDGFLRRGSQEPTYLHTGHVADLSASIMVIPDLRNDH